MKIVIDTNVIFSALINTNSAIMNIIIETKERFQFYASDFTNIELKKHDEKLKKASKLSDDEMDIAKYELFKYLNFITLDMIPKDYWEGVFQNVVFAFRQE